MPSPAYLTLKLKTQGAVEGEVSIKGREKMIEVLSFQSGVRIPIDVATGHASGRRQWEEITYTAHTGPQTVMCLQACTKNEAVVTAKFQFYRPEPKGVGGEEHFFTITAENGNIVSVKQILHDINDPEFVKYKPMEEVRITFQKVTWEHVSAKKTAIDDWSDRT